MSQSVTQKRKARMSQSEKYDSDQEDENYILIAYKETKGVNGIKEYGVVRLDDVIVKSDNKNKASLKYKNKCYEVDILKRGSLERMNNSAEHYGLCLSILTADEEENNRFLKRSRPNSNIAGARNTTKTTAAIPSLPQNRLISTGDRNNTTAATSSTATTSPSRSPPPSPQPSPPPSPPSRSPPSPIDTLLHAASNTEYISKQTMDSIVNSFNEQIRGLTEKFQSTRMNDTQFIYREKSLIDDFAGKNPVKWSLLVADHLWSKDELRMNTIEESSRTSRNALSPTRVKLLKSAMYKKFEYLQADEVKADRTWLCIKDRINGKGRNLGHRFRQLLRMGSNAVGITETGPGLGEGAGDHQE